MVRIWEIETICPMAKILGMRACLILQWYVWVVWIWFGLWLNNVNGSVGVCGSRNPREESVIQCPNGFPPLLLVKWKLKFSAQVPCTTPIVYPSNRQLTRTSLDNFVAFYRNVKEPPNGKMCIFHQKCTININLWVSAALYTLTHMYASFPTHY